MSRLLGPALVWSSQWDAFLEPTTTSASFHDLSNRTRPSHQRENIRCSCVDDEYLRAAFPQWRDARSKPLHTARISATRIGVGYVRGRWSAQQVFEVERCAMLFLCLPSLTPSQRKRLIELAPATSQDREMETPSGVTCCSCSVDHHDAEKRTSSFHFISVKDVAKGTNSPPDYGIHTPDHVSSI